MEKREGMHALLCKIDSLKGEFDLHPSARLITSNSAIDAFHTSKLLGTISQWFSLLPIATWTFPAFSLSSSREEHALSYVYRLISLIISSKYANKLGLHGATSCPARSSSLSLITAST